MAEPTEKQFSDLIAAQKATTRALMSVEERAAADADVNEKNQNRIAGGIQAAETRAANNAEALKAGDNESRSLLDKIAGGITSIFKGSKGSASSEKEKADEEEAGGKKTRGLLGKIAGGVTGMWDKMSEPVAAAKKGFMAMLKGTLVAGVLMAVVAFLQSDMWKKLKVIIIDKAGPLLEKFVKFLGDHWEEIAVLIGGILAAFVVIKAIMIGAKIVGIIQKIGIAFTTVKAFFASTMLPALTSMMVPLLPFIAIAAAIGVVLYALWNAFEDFQTTLCETGSIGEALKVGIAKFMGTILGFIPAMILKLVGWVAGLFGFDDFKKKVDAIDPIQWISDTIKGLFDKLFAWFGLLFKDPVKAMKNLVKGFFGGYLDIASWLVDQIKKPIVWLFKLFGWDDAAASVETFSLKGFVMETWNKVKCWFIGLFSWAAKEEKGDSWLVITVKKVITGIKEWFGKMFDFGTLKSSLASVINILTWLPNLVKDAVVAVTTWLLGLFGFGAAAEKVANAKNWTIGGLIMDVVDSVVKWLKGLFSWGKEAGTTAAGDFSIMKLIGAAVDSVVCWLKGIFAWGKEAGTTASGDFSLWKMITGVFKSIKKWFSDTFKFDFAGLIDSLPEWIKDPKAAVLKMIKSLTKFLPSWLGGPDKSEADLKKEAEELAAEQKKKKEKLAAEQKKKREDELKHQLALRANAAKDREKEMADLNKKITEEKENIKRSKAGENVYFGREHVGQKQSAAKVVESNKKLTELVAQNEKAKALDIEFKKKATTKTPTSSIFTHDSGLHDRLDRIFPPTKNAERNNTMTESALQKSVGSQNGGGTTVIDSSQKVVNANKTGVQNFGTPLKNTNLAGSLAAA